MGLIWTYMDKKDCFQTFGLEKIYQMERLSLL